MDEDWTADANDAILVSLVRPTPSGPEKVVSFNPKFTYAIFPEERIFGYKGLKVNIQFDARDLRPNLSISSARKFATVGDVEAVDIKEELKPYLPQVAFQSKKDYSQALKSLPDDWSPPGTLVKTTEKNGETYEIWRGHLNMPEVQQLVKRIEIAALFNIEGASSIVDEEDIAANPGHYRRWSIYFIYKKDTLSETDAKPQYTFQGYATTFNFWMYQPGPPDEKKASFSWLDPEGEYRDWAHRTRISQFLILPPFQGKGLGAFLYNTIFEKAMATASTKELTVEDPNEDFDQLRDLCDMEYLRKNVPEFVQLTVNTSVSVPTKGGLLKNSTQISHNGGESVQGIVDVAKLEDLRIKNKIAPRQFWRLVEMHLMSKLPDSVRPRPDADAEKPVASKADEHAYVLWRLLLKQRLYRRNISILGEFEITERIIKLNDTLDNVGWEYARILDRLGSKPTITDDAEVVNGKRKLNEDVDMETPSSKKARVEGV
ncbi:hypothetical protein M426DRAFT_19156 [Hypoxylon sp. CI-4A]|nr:hypothetical protein M426DRAFT_19156 [Hypoxylon sp. CI-4A]